MATGRVPTTANSPLTAKGDLFGYSTTQARVAVGNNGETLVADSSTSTGLRYTAGNVADNPIINSAMQIWQRGTSFAIPSSVSTYTTDRWAVFRGATGSTVSRQATNDTTNLPFIQYCARVQRDSGNTSTAIPYFSQGLETVNSIPYAGKTVTLSFYARAGANFSSTSNQLGAQLITGTGTDQSWLGYTGSVFAINAGFTLTTTWQRFTVTSAAVLPTNATEFSVVLGAASVTGTAGANDWFEVTGVQVDVGNVALPFRTNGATIQGELAACQRYYERVTAVNSVGYGLFGTGLTSNSTTATVQIPFKVTKRVQSTAVDTSAVGTFQMDDGVAGYTLTAITLANAYNNLHYGAVTCTSSGMTTYRNAWLGAVNTGTAYIGFSAEL
jgi:hypothetical protein